MYLCSSIQMSRLLSHNILYAAVVILWGLLTIASCDSSSRRAAMLAVLNEADSLNRNYIPITSDSLLREAVDYFDHHGTPNERLRAHYLLGCAYRDMGEAPRAIEVYHKAIVCADTTAYNCDYRTLGCAYSQMADQYHRQLLFTYEIEARKQAQHFGFLAGDTLVAISNQKFIAGAYILLNKLDRAEVVMRELLKLYKQYGFYQESLYASTILMSLYARQPNRVTDLKNLIDEYEANCNLFDEHRQLPPSNRLFFYYKGKYYESLNQLDSAEYCYRKIYHENMPFVAQDPMYRGLLSVYEKCQQADSIAKYAQLYCAANDSSIAIKDQELTAQMAASYNYNRYQQQALENAKEAHAANLRFILVSVVLIVIAVSTAFFVRNSKKKRVEQIAIYNASIAERRRLQNEINNLKAKNYDAIIAQKEKEIKALNQSIAIHEKAFHRVTAKNRMTDFEESEIVKTFNSKRVFRKGVNAPNKEEWKKLVVQFQQDMPLAYAAMSGLSPLQFQICILLLLGYEEGEIAVMQETKPQVITNAKARANKKLFLAVDSGSLRDHLTDLVAS